MSSTTRRRPRTVLPVRSAALGGVLRATWLFPLDLAFRVFGLPVSKLFTKLVVQFCVHFIPCLFRMIRNHLVCI